MKHLSNDQSVSRMDSILTSVPKLPGQREPTPQSMVFPGETEDVDQTLEKATIRPRKGPSLHWDSIWCWRSTSMPSPLCHCFFVSRTMLNWDMKQMRLGKTALLPTRGQCVAHHGLEDQILSGSAAGWTAVLKGHSSLTWWKISNGCHAVLLCLFKQMWWRLGFKHRRLSY